MSTYKNQLGNEHKNSLQMSQHLVLSIEQEKWSSQVNMLILSMADPAPCIPRLKNKYVKMLLQNTDTHNTHRTHIVLNLYVVLFPFSLLHSAHPILSANTVRVAPLECIIK